eukprot:CAMPEP_0117437018 /NCGR_PEP_ID=MMETSP0759-20121206/1305_1 /TAXON_ID=63605 /ORGANISM="Percolomonas cosmopolitus, Strain WS" /LENGTH=956 /DNA_ID=CAMNT_0005228633 /DNA_START=691 /DNA_END=3561 /DNA_ORIENTATION=-
MNSSPTVAAKSSAVPQAAKQNSANATTQRHSPLDAPLDKAPSPVNNSHSPNASSASGANQDNQSEMKLADSANNSDNNVGGASSAASSSTTTTTTTTTAPQQPSGNSPHHITNAQQQQNPFQQQQQSHPFLFASDAESPYQNYSFTPAAAPNISSFQHHFQNSIQMGAMPFGQRAGSSSNSSHSSGSSGVPSGTVGSGPTPGSSIMASHHLSSLGGTGGSAAAKRVASSMTTSSKKRKRFTGDEDDVILESVNKHKHPKSNYIDWDRVAEDCEPLARTKEQIRSRYSRIKRKGGAQGLNIQTVGGGHHHHPGHSTTTASTTSTVSHNNASHPFDRQTSLSPAILNQLNPFNQQHMGEPSAKRQKKANSASESGGSGSVSNASGEFVSFFNSGAQHMLQGSEHSGGSFSNLSEGLLAAAAAGQGNAAGGGRGSSAGSRSAPGSGGRGKGARNTARRKTAFAQTDSAHDYISQIQRELEETKRLLRDAIQTNKDQQRHLENQSEELKQAQVQFLMQRERYPKALLEYLRKTAQMERQLAGKKLREECERLGTISPRINGINVQEQWTAGKAFVDLQRDQKDLEDQKLLIEQKRKVIQKLKSTLKKEMGNSDVDEDHIFELNEQETVYKLRLNDIKKEEQALATRLKQLEIDKRAHIREIKRQRDEDRSRFNHFPTIGPEGRYFLIKLIGRGGFSEVYQAYDLKELRVVACKIHQLNSNWKDTRKENYIKHVLRECQIHKKISHPRVVQMFDTFIYDENTYVTVLEFCSGYDLDMYLKKHSMTEKKAHNIISQVFSGLKYLAEPPRKIIHFDLKPANILYCNGEIKITDFGLSKMMEEEDAIELTSQGAGTYWYLPPECFEVQNTPKISSKVDVWSAGVIFYQMLFGKKPFGNDLSQREVLHQRVISNAKVVTFPSKPVISQEAKDFIKMCLCYDQQERPDVLEMYKHPYLRNAFHAKR